MRNLAVFAIAILLLSPGILDAQACRGFATTGINVAPVMVRGDWAGMAGATFDAYGAVASRSLGDHYNGGVSFFGGKVSPLDGSLDGALEGTRPSAWGGEVTLSRSMVDTYLNQQVVCLNAGVAAQSLDGIDTELAVPATLSFGLELDGGWFGFTPHGLVGSRFVFDDGVSPRLEVGVGLTARVGPVIGGASLIKQGERDQQRGVLHLGMRL